jgi:histidine kinase
MNNHRTRVAIIGGGRACHELLSMTRADPRRLNLEVVGVADPDPDSPGLCLARELGVPLVVDDYHEFFVRNDIEMVIELTGQTEVRDEIFRSLPPHIHIVDHHASRFFWDLFARAQESRELRRHTESQVRAERNRLKNILDSLPYEILVIDRDYRVDLANRTYLENNQLELDQVVGQVCHELPHKTKPPCDLQNGKCPHAESLTAGKSISTVVSRKDERGRERFASVSAAPLRDAGGEIQGVVEAIRDITERTEIHRKLLQKEAQLTETRRRLNDTLANSRDIIFVLDADGRLLTFNQGAIRSLGFGVGEVLGRPAASLAVEPEAMEALLETTRREGHATGYEIKLRSKSGDTVVCNLGLTAYGEAGATAAEIIGIGRDITTRVRLQEEVFRKEQLAAIGKMAAGVAHEINNPLAVIDTIAGYVEETVAAERDSLKDDLVHGLTQSMERLRHQVKRAMSITHSLLGFVRKSRGGLQRVDLAALLGESLDLLAPDIKQGAVEVHRSFAEGLPQPVTDPMLLQQIIVNLLTNAVDAMEERGREASRLEVGTTDLGADGVAFYVEDNGVGIPPEAQAKIFDLFQTSKPLGKGTGIGLAIVLDIVKRLGGDIDVASRPGEGSRFTVKLPLEPAQA